VLTLSTIFIALMAIFATAMALFAHRAAMQVAQQATKFGAMRGRLIAVEGAIDSLRLQQQKLSGRFYAAQREQSETPASPDVGLAPAELRTPAPFCQNFQLGQIGGPQCDAARCECDYCKEMRGRRAATKAQLLPAARAATLAPSRSRE
jgi:hypothetical protein